MKINPPLPPLPPLPCPPPSRGRCRLGRGPAAEAEANGPAGQRVPAAGMAEAEAGAGPVEEGPAGAAPSEEAAAVIGATVPTGFEATAAAEVQEKLGSASRVSRDRGKIYFSVPARCLPQVRAPRTAPAAPAPEPC